nr:hypothetical protein BaRGS_032696 [Batillaria attramentaria]
MAKAAPEKREPRVRRRFGPRGVKQDSEEAANRRARSKSSPTISVQDLPANVTIKDEAGTETQTAKSQLKFQIESPAANQPSTGVGQGAKKPPLHLDVGRAQQGSVVEFKIKPPAMFQDPDVKPTVVMTSKGQGQTVEQPYIVKPIPECAPPLDSKTVVYPGSPAVTPTTATSTTLTSTVNSAARNDASSSESSAENRGSANRRLGRGVAMMVELFSSSDEERLRRTHPLHTRSAPDLSADIPSDDATSVPKNASNIRPAEVSKVMLQKKEKGSPVQERRSETTVVSASSAGGQSSDTPTCPQSPNNKPPLHPLKRQQSSPDRAGSDSSPKTPQKSSNAQVVTQTSSPAAAAVSSTITISTKTQVTPRVRTSKPAPKAEDNADDVPERPRSFHELLSSFEPDPQRLQRLSSLRKCASEETVAGETVVKRNFRSTSPFTSEPDLRPRRASAPTPQGTVSLQLEVRVKS